MDLKRVERPLDPELARPETFAKKKRRQLGSVGGKRTERLGLRGLGDPLPRVEAEKNEEPLTADSLEEESSDQSGGPKEG